MKRVGLVGWRGMVGSVLMQRMQEKNDFDHIDPLFFSTSQAGGKGPAIGRDVPPLKDARDIADLKAMDIIVTCQGGDYTSDIFPKLRAAGWNGYWIDAASTLRMKDDAVIILDPVNRDVIEDGLARGVKNYIGGNCTVSLMLMGLGGLFRARSGGVDDRHDLPGRFRRRRAEHARVAPADGRGASRRQGLLDDPASAILEIDRKVAETLRDEQLSHRATSACRWPAV